MAKITKRRLKSLVKDCLIEILSEGLGSTQGFSGELSDDLPQLRERKKQSRKSQLAEDNRDIERKHAVSQAINEVTSDPLMAGIFADTANTTLREQASHDGGEGDTVVNGDAMQQIIAGNKLEDIFDDTSKWAKLAFNES